MATNPRVTVGTYYALSTLSAMFPKSLANNVSFMFTSVMSALHWNFSLETVPGELQGASVPPQRPRRAPKEVPQAPGGSKHEEKKD